MCTKSKKQFYQYCKLNKKGHFETAFPENFFYMKIIKFNFFSLQIIHILTLDSEITVKHCGSPGTCPNGSKNSLKRPFRAKIWYISRPGAKPPAAPNFLKWSQFDPNTRASEKTIKQLGAAGGFPYGPKNSFFITINWKNMVEMAILRSRYPKIFLYKNH